MKTIVAIFAFLAAFTASAQLTWKADKAHTKVGFEITHLMISEVDGNFGEYDIMAKANPAFNNPEFEVTIKTASIDTDNDRRDTHLRSKDYFEVETYPTIQFKSKRFEQMRNKKFRLTGDLTIHGITKTVMLDGKLNGVITDPNSKKLKAGLKLEGTINRLDFEVGDKTPALGDEVDIIVNLEMIQQ